MVFNISAPLLLPEILLYAVSMPFNIMMGVAPTIIINLEIMGFPAAFLGKQHIQIQSGRKK
jgi:hypothetical protein